MENIKIVMVDSNAQNLISWIALNENNETVGHIFMILEYGDKIKFLDAWVCENHRKRGIFNKLWETRWEYVTDKYKGYLVYAWCLDTSLPLLKKKGFEVGKICTYVSKKI